MLHADSSRGASKFTMQIKGLSILKVKTPIALHIFPTLTLGRGHSDASRRLVTCAIEIYNQIIMNTFPVSRNLMMIQETAGGGPPPNFAVAAGGGGPPPPPPPPPLLYRPGGGGGGRWPPAGSAKLSDVTALFSELLYSFLLSIYSILLSDCKFRCPTL